MNSISASSFELIDSFAHLQYPLNISQTKLRPIPLLHQPFLLRHPLQHPLDNRILVLRKIHSPKLPFRHTIPNAEFRIPQINDHKRNRNFQRQWKRSADHGCRGQWFRAALGSKIGRFLVFKVVFWIKYSTVFFGFELTVFD